jgi:ABC-type Na+ efflux pump permease subunit
VKPRSVLRIARWEITSGATGLDRRALIAAAVIMVALGALTPIVLTVGSGPGEGIYRVGVDRSSPYYEAVRQDPSFSIHEPERGSLRSGQVDVLIEGKRVRIVDTRKGRAAGAALKAAVERHNDRLMQSEPDQVAAFPVTVGIEYVERNVILLRRSGSANGDAGGGGGGSGSGSGGGPDDSDGSPGQSKGTGKSGGLPAIGWADTLLGETGGTPSDISPPFPFVSLVLAFAFIVPMNFVIQAYASSILHERGKRRGELVLVSPVSRWAIITGKTLPYFTLMILIAAGTAAAIGGGLLSVGAVVPVALLFLSCAFVGALLARSHKELTFVLVTVSVVVTTYVFVPAIFTDIHPIAAISPLTLVVRELEGVAVSPGTFLFSTTPVVVGAVVLFGLGGGLYREEDLFAQRRVPAKLLDALANPIDRRPMAAVMSLLSIPFVFLAELLAIAVLFVLPLELSLPLLLGSIATIEEIAKSLHLYAGYERARYDRTIRTAIAVGCLSGLGFFIGEKAAAVSQVVGLFQLDLGRAAFELGAGLGGVSSSPILLGIVLLAPLALHTVTATISSLGAMRGRTPYLGALVLAILVHTAYNLGVVMTLG